MIARLVAKSGPLANSEILLGEKMTIGRSENSDITLNDPEVSRSHATIEMDAATGVWWLRDGNSRNGTVVDGKKIESTVLLRGATIQIGDSSFKFVTSQSSDGSLSGKSIAIGAVPSSIKGVIDSVASVDLGSKLKITSRQLELPKSRLALLVDMGFLLSRDEDPEQMLQDITKRLGETFSSADKSLILMGDHNKGELDVAGEWNSSQGPKEGTGVSGTIIAYAIQEKEAILASDPGSDARFAEAQSIVDGQISSAMCAPLVGGGVILGALYISSTKGISAFSQDDLKVVNVVAAQASLTIHNIQLMEKLGKRNAELAETVGELDSALKRLRVANATRRQMSRFLPDGALRLIEADPESPEIERNEKDVSVLFLDIAGYTKLLSELDDAESTRIVEKYFSAFTDCIYEGGGDINEFAGDGLMVIFGEGTKQEHALAAIETALQVTAAATELNKELPPDTKPLRINMGISSGIASVGVSRFEGARGAARWTFTAYGMTTVLASRLAAMAEDGAIMLAPETVERIGKAHALQPFGTHELKNIPDPVEIHQLITESTIATIARRK